jgi:hypothetical protein
MSAGHAPDAHSAENKMVALAISVLALLLAVAEILGQKAQTQTLQSNIEASNLWAFFQAKTMRRAIADTAADEMETMLVGVTNEAQRKAMTERIARFRTTAQRMESEPETNEGRRELMVRAKAAEALRDKAGKKHYRFELASGSFQIAIVVASAAIITGLTAMLWGAGGLAVVGLGLLLGGLIV